MDYIMVTLQTESGRQTDLKVPAFVPVGDLLGMLGEALGMSPGPEARLQAEPLGRILNNGRTLEEQGVCHGALLTVI
ncbi:EsaB/YukD family protein [Paenibacillus sp. CN-4]|uniref:EsaB/YukD family protein n=1 Tax=Paenibacillus nanchangensis TaxID=3348343 RepID=UPI00397C9D7E